MVPCINFVQQKNRFLIKLKIKRTKISTQILISHLMQSTKSTNLSILDRNTSSLVSITPQHNLERDKVCTVVTELRLVKSLKDKYPQINIQIVNPSVKSLSKGVYIGPLNSQQKPHGFGRIKYEDGSLVEANFVNGKANGKGFKIFPIDNEYYVGDFVDNHFDGRGQYHSRDINYIGEFRDSMFHGKGELRLAKGNAIFIGTLSHGQMKEGTLTWEGPSPRKAGMTIKYEYRGKFKDGKFEDKQGILRNNVGIYRGGFKEGQKNGKGNFIFEQHYQYEGQYKNNLKHGQGTLYNPQIKNEFESYPRQAQHLISYSGSFENGLPHGKGRVYREATKSLVEAQYVHGLWKDAMI